MDNNIEKNTEIEAIQGQSISPMPNNISVENTPTILMAKGISPARLVLKRFFR